MSRWEHPDTPIYVRGRNDALAEGERFIREVAARKTAAGEKAQAAGRASVADHRFEEARVLLEEVVPWFVTTARVKAPT